MYIKLDVRFGEIQAPNLLQHFIDRSHQSKPMFEEDFFIDLVLLFRKHDDVNNIIQTELQ